MAPRRPTYELPAAKRTLPELERFRVTGYAGSGKVAITPENRPGRRREFVAPAVRACDNLPLKLSRFTMDANVPSLIAAVERGDAGARETLFSALYADLHRLARRELARPGANVRLGVTTLLHEAYLDMAARSGASFPDRARFMGYAARVMRGLIIDHARSRRAAKRGGAFELTSIEGDVADASADHRELARISDALDALARSDPALAEVVDLKFFCGFSFGEIAVMRGVSERTAQRTWEKARIVLYRMLDSRTSI